MDVAFTAAAQPFCLGANPPGQVKLGVFSFAFFSLDKQRKESRPRGRNS